MPAIACAAGSDLRSYKSGGPEAATRLTKLEEKNTQIWPAAALPRLGERPFPDLMNDGFVSLSPDT